LDLGIPEVFSIQIAIIQSSNQETSFSFSCRLIGASLSPDTLAGAVVVGVVGVGVRLSSAEGTMGRKEDLTWHKGAKDIPGRWIYYPLVI
jgi:hypothetical protein